MSRNAIVVTVLLLLNILLVTCYFSLKRTNVILQKTQGIQAVLASDYLMSMEHNSMSINNVIAKDINDSVFTLSQLCGEQPTLVLRYSHIHCNSCVDSVITMLNNFEKQTGVKPLILSQYSSRRDYINFVRINQIKHPIYCVEDTLCVADKLDVPYLFVINKDLQCNNFFIPRKEYTTGIKMYLKSIKHLLE